MNLHKMKNIATIALILLLAVSFSIAIVPTAKAHDPPWDVPTFAYVSAAPNPVGVNQLVSIVMWIDKVPPSASGNQGDRWTQYSIEIKKPDGSIVTKGPFTSYAESTAFTSYTPTETGTYTITFTFPGQTASLYNPVNGEAGSASDFIGDYFMPSSATTTITVQETPTKAVEDYPLPNRYWTRPIEGQNTNWASIASNWLGAPQIVGVTQTDGAAPNSAHIMWTKPLQFGGVVGGSKTGIPGVGYYTGLSYEGEFASPIIMQGRLYYQLPFGDNSAGGGYVCVDLQTGEELWYKDYPVTGSGFFLTSYAPTFGQLYDYESPNQHGVIMNGYLWVCTGNPFAALFGLPPEPVVWIAYDPLTGENVFNITDTAGSVSGFFGGSANSAYGPNGEILLYTLSGDTPYGPMTKLSLWNNTAATDELSGTSGSDAWMWRPVGKSVNGSTAYSWTVNLSTALPAGASINYVGSDFILGSAGTSPSATMFGGYGSPDPRTVFYISLKPTTRGFISWMREYPAPAGNITRQMGPVDPVNRVFTMSDKETMQWLGYDLDTGDPLWGPVGDEPDFSYFGQIGTPGQQGYCADGKLYTTGGYGSFLYCYDTRTGNLDWTYGNGGEGNSTNGGLDTPYGNYPLFIGAIADGKIYAFSSEHSPTSPMWKGERVRCLNAETGEELWTLLGWGAIGSFGSGAWPVADGYLVYLNAYDMQIYCVGKGPSATAVTAAPKVTTANSGVLIEGTVTDQSAGAKAAVSKGLYTEVPAMSDADMGPWMEYVYMQKPMPENATGVTVKLTAIDSTGATQDIGTAVSDTRGAFSYLWTPTKADKYTIVAEFEGSGSYWPSSAETAVGITTATPASSVNPTVTLQPTPPTTTPTAPTPSPTPVPTQGPSTESPTALYVTVAAIVVIAVIAAIALLMRRRK